MEATEKAIRLADLVEVHFWPMPSLFVPWLDKKIELYEREQELLPLLLSACTPLPLGDFCRQVANELACTESGAMKFTCRLLDEGVLVRCANHTNYRTWLNHGWYDALAFHLSTCDPAYEGEEVRRSFSVGDMSELDWIPGRNGQALTVELPQKGLALGSESLEDTLLRRRSNRPWAENQLNLFEISRLLWWSTLESRNGRAMADYLAAENNIRAPYINPFGDYHIYLAALKSDDLPAGFYHYSVVHHRLSLIVDGDFSKTICNLAIGQRRAGSGAVAVVLSVTWERLFRRYGHSRSFRTALIGMAELSHTFLLVATHLGLSTFMTPAIDSGVGQMLLEKDHFEESALYVLGIG